MKFGLLVMILMSSSAFAQLFQITQTCGTSFGSNQAACDAFTKSLEDEVNANLPDVSNLSEFSDGMSNASAVATKGNQTSDYANEIDIVQVGIGTGISADIGDGSISDLSDDPTTLGGFSISPSLSVGINPTFLPVDKIGPIEMDRLRLFGNFFVYNLEQDGTEVSFEAELASVGFRARYHLVDGKGVSSLLKWGGIHITTGYQYNKMSLKATTTVNDTVTQSGGSADIEATGTLTGDIVTHSIPIEASTYVQLGYVFSVFGGIATDITFGSAKFDLDLNSTIDNTTGAAAGYSGVGSLDIDGDGSPSALLFRTFLGVQFNVPIFKLYVQAQKTLGKDVLGANVGFKLNW